MRPNICLAPLKGVTDAIFRTTYAEFFAGIDWAITPFLTTVQGGRVKSDHLKQVLPENNRLMPVVPQIIGKTASRFALLAQALYDLGYPAVNWNLGCPYPMVAKKGRGSGMLPNPEAIMAFLDQALAAISGRLSIKMRLGRRRTDEIENLLPRLNDYPIEFIAIHPRTGVQMYSGCPDLDAFERCLDLTRHPVIYNGDIVSREDYEGLKARFPQIKTWMIGRGVMMDPFLPASIKWPLRRCDDWLQQFREFHDVLFGRYQTALFGPSHLLDRMKGLWRYFAEVFNNGREIRKQIHKTRTIEHYLDITKRFFDEYPSRKRASTNRNDIACVCDDPSSG
jgi:tRNA-dihydrouridine synthase B